MIFVDAVIGMVIGLAGASVFAWALFSALGGWMDGDFDGDREGGNRSSDGHHGLAQVAYEIAYKRGQNKIATIRERNERRRA